MIIVDLEEAEGYLENDRAMLIDTSKHDSELLDKVAEKLHKKMCSNNCGERQCVDAMDRCVWYGYVAEVIAELKAEVSK